jgi:hypothetical protein
MGKDNLGIEAQGLGQSAAVQRGQWRLLENHRALLRYLERRVGDRARWPRTFSRTRTNGEIGWPRGEISDAQ